jgi:hypothetical protein
MARNTPRGLGDSVDDIPPQQAHRGEGKIKGDSGAHSRGNAEHFWDHDFDSIIRKPHRQRFDDVFNKQRPSVNARQAPSHDSDDFLATLHDNQAERALSAAASLSKLIDHKLAAAKRRAAIEATEGIPPVEKTRILGLFDEMQLLHEFAAQEALLKARARSSVRLLFLNETTRTRERNRRAHGTKFRSFDFDDILQSGHATPPRPDLSGVHGRAS